MTSAWSLPTTSFLFPFKNELLSCIYLATAFSPPRDGRDMTRFPQPRHSADLLGHISKLFFAPFVDPLEEPTTIQKDPLLEPLWYSTFGDSEYLWKEPAEAFEFFHRSRAGGLMAKFIRLDSLDQFQSDINAIVTDAWKHDKKDRHDVWVAFDNPQLLTLEFNDFAFHALGQSFDSEGDEEEQEEGPYIYAVFLERGNHFSLAFISNESIVHYEHQHTRTYVDFSEFIDKYNVVGLAVSWWAGDCDKLSKSRSGGGTSAREVAEVGERFFNALKRRRANHSSLESSSFQKIMEWYTDGLFCPMYLLDHFIEQNKELVSQDKLMFGILIYDDCRGSYSETEEMVERVNLLTGYHFTSHELLDNGWQQARIARTWLMFLYEALVLWEDTEDSVQKLMMAAAHVPRAGPNVSDYCRQFTLFLMKEQIESGHSSADKLVPFCVAAFGPEAAEKLLNIPVQFRVMDIDKFQSPITNREKPKKIREVILNAVKKWSGKFEECRNQLSFPVTEGALRFAESTNFF